MRSVEDIALNLSLRKSKREYSYTTFTVSLHELTINALINPHRLIACA